MRKMMTLILLSLCAVFGLFFMYNSRSDSVCIPMSSVIPDLEYAAHLRGLEEYDMGNLHLDDPYLLDHFMPLFSDGTKILMYDSGFSDDDMMELCDRWPNLVFVWKMSIGKKSFSTDAEEIDLSGVRMENTDLVESRLLYLHNVKKIIMSGCGISNKDMDALNRRHEDVRFVWTVHLGSLSVRTDATWFMPVKYNVRVETKDLEDFKYCTDMVCVDIGHMWVHNCDWAAYMPNLEYLIIGETQITDLSPLQGLKKLKYLELFTIKVTDYTPLLGCTGMEDLNLGLTYGDPDVIAQMTWLKNLWWCDANGYADAARREAVKRMCDALKDTQIKIYINHPTASGWRNLPNYYRMRDILGMYYLE